MHWNCWHREDWMKRQKVLGSYTKRAPLENGLGKNVRVLYCQKRAQNVLSCLNMVANKAKERGQAGGQ